MYKDQVAAVVGAVRRAGGITRSAELCRAGFAKAAIATSVASGQLLRARRVWVAIPSVDPLLLFAAQQGVVITCATQAQRLGLWVLDDPGMHVACSPHAGMVQVAAVVHRQQPLVPRHPSQLVDSIENVLAVVARCLPEEQALIIWDSAFNKGLVSIATMQRFKLGARARMILDMCDPFKDSGLETIVPARLRWLQLPMRTQIWIAGHRVDLLIGARLVVQMDGGHHVGAKRAGDIAHDAQLTLMGYHVIRVTYHQVVHEWHVVQDLITRAVAQGLHLEK